ncbi:MAG: M20/M25/M40 family metallo-hydrolase [Solirubrobacterales bacterium]|nr:M20/M25/M40 family metallo-hydrolase [Solirubrobacterales bacterium]
MIAQREVLAAVDARAPLVGEVMRFVHAHPELGHEEHECSRYLCEALARAGLEVEPGVGDIATAFRAVLRGVRPGRSVGLVCLYDAVPTLRDDGRVEPVHSCGHGPIAGGVVAAAAALADLRDELGGVVTVMGCPADEIHAPGTVERGGGKALTVEAGFWDDVDAALYAHPEFVDTVSLQSLWMRRDRLTVFGSRSLSGGDQAPLSAARAAIDAERPGEVMLERLVLDGDVEEGTALGVQCTFLFWGSSEQVLEERAAEVRARLPGKWQEGPLYQGVAPDPQLTAAVADAFHAIDRRFVDDPQPLPFATDFGNISRRTRAALIGVGREGGWAFHTDQGAKEFASDDGEQAGLTIARVLALAAARLSESA